jgi:hypothetical protein
MPVNTYQRTEFCCFFFDLSIVGLVFSSSSSSSNKFLITGLEDIFFCLLRISRWFLIFCLTYFVYFVVSSLGKKQKKISYLYLLRKERKISAKNFSACVTANFPTRVLKFREKPIVLFSFTFGHRIRDLKRLNSTKRISKVFVCCVRI